MFSHNVTFILPTVTPEIWDYVRKERYPINHIPSLIPFVQAVDNHHLIGKEVYKQVGTSNGVSELTAWKIIWRVLRVLLNQQSGIEFEESEFESVFHQMIEFFRSKTLIEEIIAPLENFIYKGEEIELPNEWKLKIVPREYKEHWKYMASLPHPKPLPASYLKVRWALVKEYKTKRLVIPKGKEFPPANNQMEQMKYQTNDIVSSLRLVKKGGIIQRLTETRVKGWGFGSPETFWEPHIPPASGIPYKLLNDEVGDFLDFISFLSQITKKDSFRIALRRLDYMTERGESPRHEDKILDATIGLESLFLAGIKEELSYRLSLRAAYFLGSAGDERQRIFKTVKALYGLRSKVIHGFNESQIKDALADLKKIHDSENRDMNLEIAANLAEDILRRSLRKFLLCINNGKTVKGVNDSLEKDIRRGMSR